MSIFGGAEGSDRLLRLRLAYLWLVDRWRSQQYPTSPLCAENLPPATFLSHRPSRVRLPNTQETNKTYHKGGPYSFGGAYRTAPKLTSRGTNLRFAQTWTDWVWQLATGGAEGSRTPVQKPIRVSVSERSWLSTFPHTKASQHAFVFSSRLIMTKLSALLGSRSPLIDALFGPRYYRIGRQLN